MTPREMDAVFPQVAAEAGRRVPLEVREGEALKAVERACSAAYSALTAAVAADLGSAYVTGPLRDAY